MLVWCENGIFRSEMQRNPDRYFETFWNVFIFYFVCIYVSLPNILITTVLTWHLTQLSAGKNLKKFSKNWLIREKVLMYQIVFFFSSTISSVPLLNPLLVIFLGCTSIIIISARRFTVQFPGNLYRKQHSSNISWDLAVHQLYQ